MPRKQIGAGAVLAAVAVSALTGCSVKASDGTPNSFGKLSSLSAADAIQAANRAVLAHPSAKVHTVLTAATASQTSDVTATFDEHPTLQGTMVTGSGAADGSGAQSAPAVPIRYADDVMYMKMGNVPSLAAQMGGKAWLKMDLQAMAQDPNTAGYGTDVVENTSPSKGLTLLAAAKDLHKVGDEQHAGVQTVHLAGTLTGDDASDPNIAGRDHLTAADADTVRAALAEGAVTKLNYDVWLGAGGLPVAMTFTEATPNGTLNGEIDYSDWGLKVAVTPIPDTQSADFVAMVKQAEAAQTGSQDSGSSTATGSASGSPSSPSSSASTSASPTTPSTPSTPATPSSPTGTESSSTPSAPATPSTPSATGSSSSGS